MSLFAAARSGQIKMIDQSVFLAKRENVNITAIDNRKIIKFESKSKLSSIIEDMGDLECHEDTGNYSLFD